MSLVDERRISDVLINPEDDNRLYGERKENKGPFMRFSSEGLGLYTGTS
jgi:hypothetical protein